MPMRYADLDTVTRHLRIAGDDTAAVARVEALENGLADALDGLIGRAFGTAPVAEARTIDALTGEVLVLPTGVISVSGVEVDGEWDGAAWTDGTALTADEYRLAYVDRDGYAHGIRGLVSDWSGPVRVTAVWADQDTEAVPDDLREAMNVLVVREYRRLHMSPQEQIGPDGVMVPAPTGWTDRAVQAVIDRYRVRRVIV